MILCISIVDKWWVNRVLLNINVNDFLNLSDEELALMSKISGNAQAVLISRHFKLISSLARKFSKNPDDIDDLVSESMLILANCAQSFDIKKCDKFIPYACVCIKNRLKTITFKKEVSTVELDELSGEVQCSPEQQLIEAEKLQERLSEAREVLSKKEWQILQLFLTEYSYEQIARMTDTTVKSVDNAMQRARKKLKTIWNYEAM